MKKNRGITLVELIIVMALLGIVLTTSFSILSFSFKAHGKTVDEYDLQSSFRLVTEYTNQIARFSTAVFTIPQSSFRENNLTDGWSYIGVMDGAIVIYEYQKVDGVVDHYKRVLVPAHPDIDYKVIYEKNDDDKEEKNIIFSIQAFFRDRPEKYDDDGNIVGHMSLLSEVEALNSLQIIHKGTTMNPAVALAYRGENREDPIFEVERPVAQVAMVLDTSGSMNWDMNGYETNVVNNRRIRKLQNASIDLINKFAASQQTVSISLVPFADHANDPKAFQDASTNTGSLIANIETLTNQHNGKTAGGGTNTGDGLRRAYYQIRNGRNNPDYDDAKINDYVIILVDGVTTFASATNTFSWSYYTGSGNLSLTGWSPAHQIVGPGNYNNNTVNEYVRIIGNMIINDGKMKVYVIGFSADPDDFGNLDQIAEYTDAEEVFEANDYDELNIVFDEIKKQILNDLWHIDGPEL
mgnify:FL=1